MNIQIHSVAERISSIMNEILTELHKIIKVSYTLGNIAYSHLFTICLT